MSSLPGFSHASIHSISQIEVDQNFETSMKQLNSSNNIYIFQEDAIIMNKERQILEWKDNFDEYLVPTGANTFQDTNGLHYQIVEEEGNTVLYLMDPFKTVISHWDYTTRFINTKTKERYESCVLEELIIDITNSSGTFKFPASIHVELGGTLIYSLNCTLDLTHAHSEIVEDFSISITEPSETGKVLITSSQKDTLIQRGSLQEIENVFWFINKSSQEPVLRAEVVPS